MALVRTSQGTSSDSINFRGYRYDVFLSFRGEDTRMTFTDHLYTALNNAGFLTFRDDDELKRGEVIKPGLRKAIHLSRTSVVVFSEDYASSRWCLDELVMILERKRILKRQRPPSDHVVLPVFYHVDPSHVRKQTESIGKAFERHETSQSPKKVTRWRKALAEVANLAGMVLQNKADGYESKFIEKIVKVIGDKLSRTPLSVEPKLVGIQSQVERINLWLQDGSSDVGIFVLYGMSGIGKTTIAKHIYNSNYKRFTGSSFIENIKEIAVRNGLVQIQMKLLYDILNGRKVKIQSVSEGISKIEGAISSRRVLLVLDDVDQMDQLDAVLRMKDRFFPGSKILITTRRERLLKAHQVTKVYNVKTLGYNESLELFSWHAFGQDHPIEEYMEHSKMAVQHSGGLPLALKLLGSSLSGESICVWQSALEKLKVFPNGEIMNKLRISYDSLQDDHDRKLFLHIACFLIGRKKNYIVRILDGCDFHTTIGIHNLIDRCLVTVSECGWVNMHDMIRGMGREIVRLESEEPEKRSRLWRHKDSFQVLREKNGSQTIQGLVLDMRMHPANSPINTNETALETNAFERMRKLQLLHLSHVRLDGCYADFPTGLRWLCWLEFPLDSIPIDFPLKYLVVLEMQHSSLRQVYKGTKFLPSLKILDVSHSHGLTEIVDFSLCPSLEELIIVDCTSLIDVHESIRTLERLVYLNMKDCKNLRMLPKNMCMLKSLETLILSGCSNLDEFPMEILKKMESLKVLEIDEIPLSELWPERSSSILGSFPYSLVELNLSGCNLSDDAFHRDLSNLSLLRTISLDKNPIRSLPVFIKSLRRLDDLSFLRCERLESLVALPKVHKVMDIRGCISLKKITYQSYGFQNSTAMMENYNLVDWEYLYKLEPIDRVDVEMTKLLGLSNLGSLPAIRMKKPKTLENRWSPVQGLYQYGIFSTFFVGNEVPGQFSHKSTMSSISFIVSLLPDHKIRGLNIFATYAKEKNSNNGSTDSDSDVDDGNERDPIMIKVRNKSKGLTWIYGPDLYGIPGEEEDIILLSHWKMENESILKCGDEVLVLVLMRPNVFQLKEFGVELVQEHQDKMSTQHNTTADLPDYPSVIGGDLSMWEHIPGLYLLGIPKKNTEYDESVEFSWLSWLNHVIMDSDEDDTGNEEDQEDEDTEEQQDDSAIVATRVVGSNNSAGVYSSDNEEEKRDEDTDSKEEQQDDQTLVPTRAAGSNNCGVKGWKVLIMAAVLLVLLFFMWSLCSLLAKESREKFMEFTVPT
ncbi:disease resistance protein RUN1-like isoform X1 [Malus sylvestris]|uniref:disease resistance protein RUN1-like isoform X1 n=1 Tax=Malus sylvestris TaxID=3752 RepID=UPI0021ACBFB3|nr:disease resistance protein RUN1-like isoform X1 [Malus sylvestris]